jgi:AcrR family transcriptional regulator
MVEISARGILAPSEREQILRAAAALCAERGYGELTVEAIVERAGSSSERFGHFFAGLEDCLLAAVNAITAETLAAVSGAYSPDLSEWDSGLAGIRSILELMAAHPDFAYLGYIGSRQMAPKRIFEVYSAACQMLAAMIERLWEYSQLDVQPRAAARAALGGCEALVRAEIVGGRIEQLPRLLPDLVYTATVPFLGQEEAMRLARRGRELLAGSEWGADVDPPRV